MNKTKRSVLIVSLALTVTVGVFAASKVWIGGRYRCPLYDTLGGESSTFIFSGGILTHEIIDPTGIMTSKIIGSYEVIGFGSYLITSEIKTKPWIVYPGLIGLWVDKELFTELGITPPHLGAIMFFRKGF